MAEATTPATGKKSKLPTWGIVLISVFGTLVVVYFMWPKNCVNSKADVKYNPLTGEKITDAASITTNPVTGEKLTA